MRSILNISLPEEEKREIEKRARKAKMSVSAYVLKVFKLEKELISEDELAEMANQARLDYKAGKTKSIDQLIG